MFKKLKEKLRSFMRIYDNGPYSARYPLYCNVLDINNLYIQRGVNFCTINKYKSVGIFSLPKACDFIRVSHLAGLFSFSFCSVFPQRDAIIVVKTTYN